MQVLLGFFYASVFFSSPQVVKKGHLKLNKLHMRLCMYFNLIYLAASKKPQQPETDSSMEVHVSNNNEAFLCVCVLIFSCYISNISVLSGWLCCKKYFFLAG